MSNQLIPQALRDFIRDVFMMLGIIVWIGVAVFTVSALISFGP